MMASARGTASPVSDERREGGTSYRGTRRGDEQEFGSRRWQLNQCIFCLVLVADFLPSALLLILAPALGIFLPGDIQLTTHSGGGSSPPSKRPRDPEDLALGHDWADSVAIAGFIYFTGLLASGCTFSLWDILGNRGIYTTIVKVALSSSVLLAAFLCCIAYGSTSRDQRYASQFLSTVCFFSSLVVGAIIATAWLVFPSSLASSGYAEVMEEGGGDTFSGLALDFLEGDGRSNGAKRGVLSPRRQRKQNERKGTPTLASMSRGQRGFGPRDPNFSPLALPPQQFLEAEGGKLQNAVRRWRNTLLWREINNVGSIIDRPSPLFFEIKQVFPHYFHGKSERQEPLLVLKCGRVALSSIKNGKIAPKDFEYHFVFLMEYALKVFSPPSPSPSPFPSLPPASEGEDRREDDGAIEQKSMKLLVLIDMAGVRLQDISAEVLAYLQTIVSMLQTHYPERVSQVFVANVPFWFDILWKALSPHIEKRTRKKILLLKTRSLLEDTLSRIFSPSLLPIEYGGLSTLVLGESLEEEDLTDYVKVKLKEVFKEEAGLLQTALEPRASPLSGPILSSLSSDDDEFFDAEEEEDMIIQSTEDGLSSPEADVSASFVNSPRVREVKRDWKAQSAPSSSSQPPIDRMGDTGSPPSPRRRKGSSLPSAPERQSSNVEAETYLTQREEDRPSAEQALEHLQEVDLTDNSSPSLRSSSATKKREEKGALSYHVVGSAAHVEEFGRTGDSPSVVLSTEASGASTPSEASYELHFRSAFSVSLLARERRLADIAKLHALFLSCEVSLLLLFPIWGWGRYTHGDLSFSLLGVCSALLSGAALLLVWELSMSSVIVSCVRGNGMIQVFCVASKCQAILSLLLPLGSCLGNSAFGVGASWVIALLSLISFSFGGIAFAAITALVDRVVHQRERKHFHRLVVSLSLLAASLSVLLLLSVVSLGSVRLLYPLGTVLAYGAIVAGLYLSVRLAEQISVTDLLHTQRGSV